MNSYNPQQLKKNWWEFKICFLTSDKFYANIHVLHLHVLYFSFFCTLYSFFYNVFSSQLFYDGHQQLAVQLSNLVKAHPACPPSDRLFKVVKFGLESEEGEFSCLVIHKCLFFFWIHVIVMYIYTGICKLYITYLYMAHFSLLLKEIENWYILTLLCFFI